MKQPLKNTLHEHGLRCTEPRRCILQALQSGPKSHAQILEATQLDRVTVYRNLIALQKAGLIYRVHVPGHDSLYVLCERHGDRHAHFFCEKCGKGICLPEGAVEVAGPWGAWVDKVLLLGRCGEQCMVCVCHEKGTPGN